MRVLVETIDFNNNFELLKEKDGASTKLVGFKGPYFFIDEENQNARTYPKAILEVSTNKYIDERLKTNRAVGELGHPYPKEGDAKSKVKDAIRIHEEKICHRVTDITMDSKAVIGVSRFVDTPTGNMARGLLDSGVALGVSPRGVGVTETGDGRGTVTKYVMIAPDLVLDPSNQSEAERLYESIEFNVDEFGGIFEQEFSKLKNDMSSLPNGNKSDYMIKKVLSFLNSIK